MSSADHSEKTIFVSKTPPDPVPVEQLTKFLLSFSVEFDAKSQTLFLEFLQNNGKLLAAQQNYARKPLFHLSRIVGEKLIAFQKKNLKLSLLRSSFKAQKREIELPKNKVPPKTKLYISLNSSLRIDEHQTLDSILGPRSIDTLCNKQDYEIFEGMKRNSSKLPAINLSSIPKLVFMVKKFQLEYGMNLLNIRTLAAFLDLDPTSIAYFWLEEAKRTLQEPQEKNRKIYTQKYLKFFCNICHIYACNFHFSNKDELLDEEEANVEFTNFYNVVTPQKKQLFVQNFREIHVNWVSVYRCAKELNSYCYRNLDQNLDLKNVEIVKLKKYQKELINHCITYNILTPCFVYLLAKSYVPSENFPCLAYYLYILQNGLLKTRDEFQRNLKLANEMDSRSQEKLKEKELRKLALQQKKQKQMGKNYSKDAEFMEYIPCFHDNACDEENCYCLKNRGYCEKYCCCSSFCELRFKGCDCQNGDCFQTSCECFKNQRECDPDACLSCSAKNNKHFLELVGFRKIPVCKNSSLTYKVRSRLLLGKSTICQGFGIFAGQTFKVGDFIGEYVGEILNFEEAEKRGRIYSLMNVYYLFTLNYNNVIDAYMYGNKTRFINHGSFGIDNATVKIMYCQGEHRIGIYAQKDISIGDEILFDYGSKFNVPWLLEFNDKMKKKQKEIMRKKKEKKGQREEIQLFDREEEYQLTL